MKKYVPWILLMAIFLLGAQITSKVADGKVIQRAYSAYSTYSSTAGNIPYDDTIPQSNEGGEITTQAITPINAGNIIRVTANVHVSGSGAGTCTLALFKNSDADALAATPDYASAAGFSRTITLVYEESAGSTTARTYKIRAGHNAGTTYFNGGTGSRAYGGVAESILMVEEIEP